MNLPAAMFQASALRFEEMEAASDRAIAKVEELCTIKREIDASHQREQRERATVSFKEASIRHFLQSRFDIVAASL